jgi:hypothetical protein
MQLHGVLLFATEQRPSLAEEGGAIITTGHFIHNYPLIYGVAGVSVESYAVIPSLHFTFYGGETVQALKPRVARTPLHYGFVEEQIKNLMDGRDSVYVYPAYPVRVSVKKIFMQARGTSYAEFRGALKTVYPRLVHYVALIPPSEFRTIILTSGIELPRELYIRIGMKRMGLFKVYLREAKILGRIEDLAWSNVPVNIYDVSLFGYTPSDVIKVMETRSKPPSKPSASIIGYIRARGLFLVEPAIRVPLPLKLLGDAHG